MVGFGGATGYLAAMSLFDIPPQVMASTALLLNIGVAGISFASFFRAGHFSITLAWPFLLTSIPAAFLGGYFKISDQTYMFFLYAVLTFVAFRLLFISTNPKKDDRIIPIPVHLGLLVGLVIGLISGMIGIGGGIFLCPLIIFAGWGTSKQASATAASFIVLNSISGLVGRLIGGSFVVDAMGVYLIPIGLASAIAGSRFGAIGLSGTNLKRAVGVVMAVAVSTFWWSSWK